MTTTHFHSLLHWIWNTLILHVSCAPTVHKALQECDVSSGSNDVPHSISVRHTTISRAIRFTWGHLLEGPTMWRQSIPTTLPSALTSLQLWRQEVNTDIVQPRLPETKWEQTSLIQLKPLWLSVRQCIPHCRPGPITQPPAVCTCGLECTALSGPPSPDKYQCDRPTRPNRNQRHKLHNLTWNLTEVGIDLAFPVKPETLTRFLFPPRKFLTSTQLPKNVIFAQILSATSLVGGSNSNRERTLVTVKKKPDYSFRSA